MRSFLSVVQQFIIQRSARRTPSRRLALMNLETIRTVCLLVEFAEGDNVVALNQAKEVYRQLGKETDMFVFLSSKAFPPQLTASQHHLIKKQDLNMAGLLNADSRAILTKRSYDMVVYYNPGNYAPAVQAATMARSKITIGTPGSAAYTPEVVLHTRENGIAHFINTVNNYLKQINQSL